MRIKNILPVLITNSKLDKLNINPSTLRVKNPLGFALVSRGSFDKAKPKPDWSEPLPAYR